MKKLLYLTDVNQVQFVLENHPSYFVDMIPMTGQLVVIYELKRLKIEFLNEWEYLSSLDIEKNFNTSASLIDEWYDADLPQLNFYGLDLPALAKEELAYAFECCLNASVVYHKIFDDLNIESISGFFLEPVPVIRNGPAPTIRPIQSIAQAVLFMIAEQRSIKVTQLSLPPLSNVNIFKPPVNKWRRMGKFFKKRKFAQSGFKSSAPKLAILFYDLMPGSEHSSIIEHFNELKDWNLVSVKKDDLECLSLASPKDHVNKKETLAEFLQFKNQNTGLYPEIFDNRFLDFQFSGIWDEMNLAVQYGESYLQLLSILDPDLVIFAHEALTTDRILVNITKNKGVPTLAFLHGGLGSISGYRGVVGDADYIVVWNERDAICLNKYGVDYSRILKWGSMRYEEKLRLYRSISEKYTNHLSTYKKFKLDPAKPVILFLTTAINVGFSLPFANPISHLEDLDDLLDLARRRSDLQFVFKPHPGYDYYELYRRFENLQLSNIILLEDVYFDEIIGVTNVAVMLNYFTTAALESMLNKVPVIYLNSAVYKVKNYDILLDAFNLNVVDSCKQLENKVDKLLTDVEYKTKSLHESDVIINQLLPTSQGSFKKRIDDLFSSDKKWSNSKNIFSDLNPEKLNLELSNIPEHLILYYIFCLGAMGFKMNQGDFFKSPIYEKYKFEIIQAYILGNRFCKENDKGLIPVILWDLVRNKKHAILNRMDVVTLALSYK